MSLALTGTSQDLGNSIYKSSKAYFDYVNKKGGVHGRSLEIIAYDDYYDPEVTVRNTVTLVEKDHVDLLYGYVGTPTVTRMLPLLKYYEKQHMYLFFPFTGAEPQRLYPYSEYTFNLRASYLQETKGLVDHFVSIGRKRIAVFYQSDGYGRNGWSGVKQGLSNYDLSIVSESTYRRGAVFTESYKSQVSLIVTGRPDAIICVGSYQACAGFIRDLRNQGIEIPVANISFVGSESLLTLLQEESEQTGRNYTQNLINSNVVPYNERGLKATKEFYNVMGYNPDVLFNAVEFEGYLNAKLLVACLKRVKPPFTKLKIPSGVFKIKKFDLGIRKLVTFARGENQGLDAVFFTTVESDHYETIKDWSKWKK